MQNLTVFSINQAVTTFDHLNAAHVAIIKDAVARGYVLQMSVTQVQWTDAGLAKAKAELPDFTPGDAVTTWMGDKGVVVEIQTDGKLKPLVVEIDRTFFYFHFSQCVKDGSDFVFINRELYRLGVDTCLSIGQNSQCFDVVTKSVICRNAKGEFYLKNGGINVLLENFNPNEFWVNSRYNAKLLREKCAAKKLEWEKAVEKQLAEIRKPA